MLGKYRLFAKTIDYLSHFIQLSRLELAENTIHVVAKLEHPATQIELCSLLDLCTLFRWFVQKFSRLYA